MGIIYGAAGVFLGALGLLAAQAAEEGGGLPYFSQTVVGISVVGILVLFWKIQRSIIHPLERRVRASEVRERVCVWRLARVVTLLSRGEPVTMSVVTERPPWLDDGGYDDLDLDEFGRR